MFAAICVNSLLRVSYELLAEAVGNPSTRAAIVAMTPIPSFTSSFESVLR